MFRTLAILGILGAGVAAHAQAPRVPARLQWREGQTLLYKIEQMTQVSEVVGGVQADSKNHLNVTRRWQVVGVDKDGVATLQMSVAALRTEITKTDGEVLLFDSQDMAKSTPGLKEQMNRYVGATLAVVRVDPFGKVVEVKESKLGPASSFETDPPFVGVLSAEGLAAGSSWERAYQIVLEPPQGAGEKYAAVQKFVCKEVVDGKAQVTISTTIKDLPEAAGDKAPLLQMMPEGEMVFDLKAGRLQSAILKIDQELKGHQGENSSYRLRSTYSVQYAGDR